MTEFWILILICNTMYTAQPGRRWVTAQSLTESPVYQPDEELSVDIGDSATLRCCISETKIGIIALFKQPKRKRPYIMGTIFISAGEAFYSESQNSNFQINRSSNCFNITILKTTKCDEATYFCALITPDQFGDGTYLKIKGENVTIASKTSKPALCNDSTVCEQTLHGNSTNMNKQEKTVLCLGMALGLCVLLIFGLAFSLLRRGKCDKINSCKEDSQGSRQESEIETLNYSALNFSKRKAKPEIRKTHSQTECVYSDVKKNCKM